jgi:hypothetical protein
MKSTKEASRSTPPIVTSTLIGIWTNYLRSLPKARLAAAGSTRLAWSVRAATAVARRFGAGRRLRTGLLVGLVGCESGLLLISLVPPTIWARLGHPDGPLPQALYPLVAGLFYLLPTLIGALCHRWPAALALATLPAWADLGVFAVAAAPRLGPFYLAQDPHAVSTVGTLELFAALGLLGWVTRRALHELRNLRTLRNLEDQQHLLER